MTSCVWLNLAFSALISSQVVLAAILHQGENDDNRSYLKEHHTSEERNNYQSFYNPYQHNNHHSHVDNQYPHHKISDSQPDSQNQPNTSEPKQDDRDEIENSLLDDLYNYISGNGDRHENIEKKHHKREYPNDMYGVDYNKGYNQYRYPNEQREISNRFYRRSDYEDNDGSYEEEYDEEFDEDDDNYEEEEEDDSDDYDEDLDEDYDEDYDDYEERRILESRSIHTPNGPKAGEKYDPFMKDMDKETLSAFSKFLDNMISDQLQNMTTTSPPRSSAYGTNELDPTSYKSTYIQGRAHNHPENRTIPLINSIANNKNYRNINKTTSDVNTNLEKVIHDGNYVMNEGRSVRHTSTEKTDENSLDWNKNPDGKQIFFHIRDGNNDEKKKHENAPPAEEFDARYQNAYDMFINEHEDKKNENDPDILEEFNFAYSYPKFQNLERSYKSANFDTPPVILMRVNDLESYKHDENINKHAHHNDFYPTYESAPQSHPKYKRDLDRVTNIEAQNISQISEVTENITAPNHEETPLDKEYVYETISINSLPHFTLEGHLPGYKPGSHIYKINDIISHQDLIKDQIQMIPNTVMSYLVESFLSSSPENALNNTSEDGMLVNIYGDHILKPKHKRDVSNINEGTGEVESSALDNIATSTLEDMIAYQLSQATDIRNENLTEPERRQLYKDIIMKALSEATKEEEIQNVQEYDLITNDGCEYSNPETHFCTCDANDDFEKTFINIKNLNIFYEFGESGQNCVSVPNKRVQYTLPCNFQGRRPLPVKSNYQTNTPNNQYRNPLNLRTHHTESQTTKQNSIVPLQETGDHHINLHHSDHNDNLNKITYKREDISSENEAPQETTNEEVESHTENNEESNDATPEVHNAHYDDETANKDEESSIVESELVDHDNAYANLNITTLDVEEPVAVAHDNVEHDSSDVNNGITNVDLDNVEVDSKTSGNDEKITSHSNLGEETESNIKEIPSTEQVVEENEAKPKEIHEHSKDDISSSISDEPIELKETADETESSSTQVDPKTDGVPENPDQGIAHHHHNTSSNVDGNTVETHNHLHSVNHNPKENSVDNDVENQMMNDESVTPEEHSAEESEEEDETNHIQEESEEQNASDETSDELNTSESVSSIEDSDENSNEDQNSSELNTSEGKSDNEDLDESISKEENDIVLEERVRVQKDETESTSEGLHKDNIHKSQEEPIGDLISGNGLVSEAQLINESELNDQYISEEDASEDNLTETEDKEHSNMKYKSIVYNKPDIEEQKEGEHEHIDSNESTESTENDIIEPRFEKSQEIEIGHAASNIDRLDADYDEDRYYTLHDTDSTEEDEGKKIKDSVDEEDSTQTGSSEEKTEEDTSSGESEEQNEIDVENENSEELSQRLKRKHESEDLQEESTEAENIEVSEEDEKETSNEESELREVQNDENKDNEDQEGHDESTSESGEESEQADKDEDNEESELKDTDSGDIDNTTTEDVSETCKDDEINNDEDNAVIDESGDDYDGEEEEKSEDLETDEETSNASPEPESEENEVDEETTEEKDEDSTEDITSDELSEEHYKENEDQEQIRTAKSANEYFFSDHNNSTNDHTQDGEQYDAEYVRKCDVEKLILDILESKPHPDHDIRHSNMFPHRPDNKYKELVKDIASYFAKKNITSGDDICVYEEYGSKRGDDDVIILSGTKLYQNGITKKDGQNYNLIIKKPHDSKTKPGAASYDIIEYRTEKNKKDSENKADKVSLLKPNKDDKKITSKEQKPDKINNS